MRNAVEEWTRIRSELETGGFKDLYINCEEIRNFVDIYESSVCSSCAVERLFSFFRRTEGTFMRQSLDIETLLHLGRVYLNYCIPAHIKKEEELEDAEDEEEDEISDHRLE